MKRIFIIGIVLAMLVSLIIAMPASAAGGAIIYNSNAFSSASGVWTFTSTTELSQVFINNTTNYLSSISLELAESSVTTGNIQVGLYSVMMDGWQPNGLIEAGQSISVGTLTANPAIYSVDFSSPVELMAGVSYAIVLTVDSGNSVGWYFGNTSSFIGSAYDTSGSSGWSPFSNSTYFYFQEYGTSAQYPSWSTVAATSLGNSTATLNGSITTLGSYGSIEAKFLYGPTGAYGSSTAVITIREPTGLSCAITGLFAGNIYHCNLYLEWGGVWYPGNDVTFTTTGSATTTSATTTAIGTTTTGPSITYTLEESNTGQGEENSTVVEANDPYNTPAYHYLAQNFQAASTYTMEQVGIDVGQISTNGSGNLNIVLETNTGNTAPQAINNLSTSIIAPVIASATVSSNLIPKANPISPNWIYVNLGAPVTVYSGDWYTWVIWTQTTVGNVNYEISAYGDCSWGLYGNTTLITDWSPFFGWSNLENPLALYFKNYGTTISQPSILTLPPTKGADGNIDVMNGEVQNLGPDSSVTAYFYYGGTSILGSDTTALSQGETTLTKAEEFSFYFPIAEAPSSWTAVYFEAVMIGSPSGAITTATSDPTKDIFSVNNFNNQVFTDKISKVTQTTAESGVNLILGPSTSSMDIQLAISSDQQQVYDASNGYANTASIIEVNSAATAGDYPVPITGLTAATKYWICALAIDPTSLAITGGNILPFTTNSPPGPGGIITTLLNDIGVGMDGWWIILAALMAAIWIVEPIRENPIVGVAIDAVLLGGFISLKLLNPWLITILAILAGAILAGVLIKGKVRGD